MAIDSIIKMNEVVDNTERKFGEALEYYPVRVKTKEGEDSWAMFTENEIKDAMERASKNKEDIPKTLWKKLFG